MSQPPHDDPPGSRPEPGDPSARDDGREGRRRRRERRRAERDGRKERVLHTRISDRLADDIRQISDDLRVPVSNLVRNVLEEVFSVVESVSDDVGGIIEDVVDEAEDARERMEHRIRQHRRRRRRHRGERGAGLHADEDAENAGLERELASDESEEARDEALRRAPRPADPEPDAPGDDDLLGWQPVILHRARTCGACGRDLARGERAFVGLGERGPTGGVRCERCVEVL